MTGYLGKKVDVRAKGQIFSGYVFEIFDAEDSDIGKDCIDVSLIDQDAIVEIAIDEIEEISIDTKFKEFPAI